MPPVRSDTHGVGKIENNITEQITRIINEGNVETNEFVTNITQAISYSIVPFNLPTVTLAAGEFYQQRFVIPDGLSLSIYQAGYMDTTWSAPLDLDFWLHNSDTATSTMLATSTRDTGNPIHSVAGPANVAFRLENSSTGEMTGNAYAIGRLAPPE